MSSMLQVGKLAKKELAWKKKIQLLKFKNLVHNYIWSTPPPSPKPDRQECASLSGDNLSNLAGKEKFQSQVPATT